MKVYTEDGQQFHGKDEAELIDKLLHAQGESTKAIKKLQKQLEDATEILTDLAQEILTPQKEKERIAKEEERKKMKAFRHREF